MRYQRDSSDHPVPARVRRPYQCWRRIDTVTCWGYNIINTYSNRLPISFAIVKRLHRPEGTDVTGLERWVWGERKYYCRTLKSAHPLEIRLRPVGLVRLGSPQPVLALFQSTRVWVCAQLKVFTNTRYTHIITMYFHKDARTPFQNTRMPLKYRFAVGTHRSRAATRSNETVCDTAVQFFTWRHLRASRFLASYSVCTLSFSVTPISTALGVYHFISFLIVKLIKFTLLRHWARGVHQDNDSRRVRDLVYILSIYSKTIQTHWLIRLLKRKKQFSISIVNIHHAPCVVNISYYIIISWVYYTKSTDTFYI